MLYVSSCTFACTVYSGISVVVFYFGGKSSFTKYYLHMHIIIIQMISHLGQPHDT